MYHCNGNAQLCGATITTKVYLNGWYAKWDSHITGERISLHIFTLLPYFLHKLLLFMCVLVCKCVCALLLFHLNSNEKCEMRNWFISIFQSFCLFHFIPLFCIVRMWSEIKIENKFTHMQIHSQNICLYIYIYFCVYEFVHKKLISLPASASVSRRERARLLGWAVAGVWGCSSPCIPAMYVFNIFIKASRLCCCAGRRLKGFVVSAR